MWVVCLFSCNIYIIRILIWLYSFSYSFHFLNWLRWCFRIHIGFHSHFFNQWMYPAAFVLLALFTILLKLRFLFWERIYKKLLNTALENSCWSSTFLLLRGLFLETLSAFSSIFRVFEKKKYFLKVCLYNLCIISSVLLSFFPPLSMKREIYFWKF